MAIQCPQCKNIFDDDQSYQNHLPCTVHGGREDLQKFREGSESGGVDGDGSN